MDGFGLWLVGQVVLPLTPVGAIILARWLMSQPVSVDAILGDGVLFFYGTSVSAILAIDVLKEQLAPEPKLAAGPAGLIVAFSFVVCILTTICYAFLALVRASAISGTRVLTFAHFSWQSATLILICAIVFRIFSGIY